jgi:L-lactate dehydrogenase complex protein LldF
MKKTPGKIKTYVHEALSDTAMRTAVANASDTSKNSRDKIAAKIPYWDLVRKKVRSFKKDVLEHLDEYLVEFESNCQAGGIKVHWAPDAVAAREIIGSIARDCGARTIVKSKSLTTEEIDLNAYLIENGLDPVETDLGEYIVQLLGQIPSHLVAPALHLSRQDIGRVFQEKLGVEYTEDPAELTEIARVHLREKFLTAEMGISGANFGIADEGCVCVVENECNARLTISLPKVHVAVMGIEKLIPNMAALPYFLKLLPASATGQKASSYVNIIGGPGRDGSDEGPREVHVVLLDNGRSKILGDGQLRETLMCMRCGACLNTCPVYREIGGHAYGWVYMGPIGSALIPQYLGLKEGCHAPSLSSLCGACHEICPLDINIPRHLLKLRNLVVKAGQSPLLERMAMKMWAFAAARPRLYRFVTWFPGKFQMLLPGKRAFAAPGYFRRRAIGRFDSKGFAKRFREMEK